MAERKGFVFSSFLYNTPNKASKTSDCPIRPVLFQAGELFAMQPQ